MQTSSPRLRVAAGLLVGGLALGGCASDAGSDAGSDASAGSSASTPSRTPPGTPPGTPSGAPSGAPSGTSSGTPSGAPVPRCTTADVSLTLRRGDAAAGSVYSLLRMRNTSTSACRTRGFGGVSYVARRAGAQVGAAADRVQRDQVRPLTVQPGASVQATLRETSAGSYPSGECRLTRIAGLRVYPPDETRWVFLPHPTRACADADVHLLELAPYARTG